MTGYFYTNNFLTLFLAKILVWIRIKWIRRRSTAGMPGKFPMSRKVSNSPHWTCAGGCRCSMSGRRTGPPQGGWTRSENRTHVKCLANQCGTVSNSQWSGSGLEPLWIRWHSDYQWRTKKGDTKKETYLWCLTSGWLSFEALWGFPVPVILHNFVKLWIWHELSWLSSISRNMNICIGKTAFPKKVWGQK